MSHQHPINLQLPEFSVKITKIISMCIKDTNDELKEDLYFVKRCIDSTACS